MNELQGSGHPGSGHPSCWILCADATTQQQQNHDLDAPESWLVALEHLVVAQLLCFMKVLRTTRQPHCRCADVSIGTQQTHMGFTEQSQNSGSRIGLMRKQQRVDQFCRMLTCESPPLQRQRRPQEAPTSGCSEQIVGLRYLLPVSPCQLSCVIDKPSACDMTEAEAPKEAPTSGSTKQLAGLGRAVGIWSRASGKLFSLEARIKDQVLTCVAMSCVFKTAFGRAPQASCQVCRPA